MKELLTLLRPRCLAFRSGRSGKSSATGYGKLIFMGTIGLAFWGGSFAVFYRILKYFQSIEGFGDILANKLLSMVLLTFFALLIFSSIITSLSKFYLSRDLILVHSLPVRPATVFLARFLESSLDSSWMVILYSLPVFLSYGIVNGAGGLYYAIVVPAFLPLCLIASAVSSLFVLLMARLLPAGRVRSVFIFFGLAVFLTLMIAFRLMRPEQLVNPDTFSSLLLYFRSLSAPASPLLPTTWVYDSLRAAVGDNIPSTVFHCSLTWSFAVTSIYGAVWTAGACYFQGFSKAQTALEKLFAVRLKQQRKGLSLFMKLLPEPVRAFMIKEVKTFFRDQTQWPQLFILMAVIVIYVYNFSVLPLEQSPIPTIYLQNVVSFLNMGLAAFVLTAVAARFVFPAVSMEGEAFWIVRTSPLTLGAFLWIKFFVYYLPLVILAELLIVITNILLHVTPFMMALSTVTMFFMVPGIVSLGIGMGAMYPNFALENPAQSVTSFGGLLFMIFSALFIGLVVVLEAGPVYTVFMAGVRGRMITFFQWLWIIGSFSAVLLLCTLALVVPMRMGIVHLREK